MKLKEKFTTMVLDKDIADWEKECEQIADEFAIDFAEWLIDNCWNIDADRFLYEEEQFRFKELLEIYKKEKGL